MRIPLFFTVCAGLFVAAAAPPVIAARAEVRLTQDAGREATGRKPTEAERKGAIESIEGQLKAFKANDWKKAITFQSSELKDVFPTTADFEKAIKEGYPQFASYKSATFGEATCNKSGEQLVIQITLTGTDNVTVKGVYVMVKEEGQYRVGSVLGGRAEPKNPKDEV